VTSSVAVFEAAI